MLSSVPEWLPALRLASYFTLSRFRLGKRFGGKLLRVVGPRGPVLGHLLTVVLHSSPGFDSLVPAVTILSFPECKVAGHNRPGKRSLGPSRRGRVFSVPLPHRRARQMVPWVGQIDLSTLCLRDSFTNRGSTEQEERRPRKLPALCLLEGEYTFIFRVFGQS